ncbi:Uncharacterized protein C15orf41,Uncharacterized protein C15orf41 homolog [Lepeophtheirus salmonis]|uniref:CDAN1-interacting nuclease 1 n=1 Tax=Lepeophtheirus salmonis TaxID=72036 RepID=A0A7R8D7X5_LEPSM|nr:CDAN1-interacting nuclease 1-like [Lepeophtheirus salmonis]CAB4068219.1 Uncharacterized protein C15orf41,Uncharacterized protein C15orf41 homolog [Lepeophtheirus salmonis]CAF3003755.1 Uncharacterized protein C15orf41,Uncharacterized protein C15orf41 homolog [Lepeophtheirus salmonis]
MKQATYESIILVIDECEFDFDQILAQIIKKFPDISPVLLRSILSLEYQRRIKKNFYRHSTPQDKKRLYDKFVKRVRAGDPPGVIVQLAKANKFAPALIGRSILESSLSDNYSKNQISDFGKYTSLVEDRDLAYEVFLANVKDEMYGSFSNSIRHCIGAEYEQLVKNNLKKLDIAFLDENDLRDRGYDKTPDVKLEVPIAVNGTIINWIESKALFGDKKSHKGYLDDQLWSYWNRFGPGLVIYWFGFIDELNDLETGKILLSDSFPENITYFKP